METFLVMPDRSREAAPVTIPINRATTMVQPSTKAFREAGQAFVQDRNRADFYSRIGNSTANFVGKRIAHLEQTDEALLFPSGMAAICTTLLGLLKAGDHLVCQTPIYGHTQSFATDYISQFGIDVDFVELPTPVSIQKMIQANTKLVYLETPANPYLILCDIPAIAAVVNKHRIPVVVDSTFATPYLQKPVTLGASLVIHSGTKYLAGHSDVICGVVAGWSDVISRLHSWQIRLGTVIDPQGAWLLDRGLKTLPLRMERHCENALKIATILVENDDVISRVYYPWLRDSPYYNIATTQMPKGSGGMISFEVRDGMKCARAFLDALDVISIGTSLGGVESLIEIPSDIQYFDNDDSPNSRDPGNGNDPVLVRLSVGIESAHDLMFDIERGIRAARETAKQ